MGCCIFERPYWLHAKFNWLSKALPILPVFTHICARLRVHILQVNKALDQSPNPNGIAENCDWDVVDSGR